MKRQEAQLTGRTSRSIRVRVLIAGWIALLLACGTACEQSGGRAVSTPERISSLPLLSLVAPSQFSPDIRVQVTTKPVSELNVSVGGDCRVCLAHTDRVVWSPSRLKDVGVTATSVGIRIGDREIPSGRIDIHPAGDAVLRINDHEYRGSLRLIRRPGRRLIAVNILPLESYLASVVDSEMPAAFPDEARKAQAIVARTYALYQMQQAESHPDYDVYASVRSQKYLGLRYRDSQGRWLAGESQDSQRIVRETAGLVCLHSGRLFSTYFSAVCGGRTTRGTDVFADACVCLQSVPCTWCRDARRYRWSARWEQESAERALRQYFSSRGEPFGELKTVRTIRSADIFGTAEFEFGDGVHHRILSSLDLRTLAANSGVQSPSFDLELRADVLEFSGRGHGHGVGLCQWGARGQALAGHQSLEIVEHYYPGCEVVRLRTRPERFR